MKHINFVDAMTRDSFCSRSQLSSISLSFSFWFFEHVYVLYVPHYVYECVCACESVGSDEIVVIVYLYTL